MRTYVWEKNHFPSHQWTSYWFAFEIKQTTSLFYLEVNRRRFRGRDISRKKVNGDNFITPIVATFYPYVKVISNGFLTAQNKFRIRSFHMHYTPCFLQTLYKKKKKEKPSVILPFIFLSPQAKFRKRKTHYFHLKLCSSILKLKSLPYMQIHLSLMPAKCFWWKSSITTWQAFTNKQLESK